MLLLLTNNSKIITILTLIIIQSCYASSQKFSFNWSASLHPGTGKAFSQEISTLPTSSFISGHRSSNVLAIRDFFLNYPYFVCSWKVFGGLFRAHSNKDNQEVSICDALFGCHLLRFGKPRDCKGENLIGIEFPIVGGMLAREPGGCLRFSVARNNGILKTEINNYSPWIVGDSLPIPWVRKKYI